MEKSSLNGSGAGLAQYETPFADVQVVREQTDENFSSEDFFSNFLQQAESPFSRTYEAASASNTLTPEGEEYVDFLGELNDSEFTESLYELANEMEDTWRNKISNELALGNNYLPYVNRQANEYIAPLLKEAENMIDQVTNYFSTETLADHSEAEIESYFETLEFDHSQFTPVQEQFLGKVFKKVKSVVKKGVDLAKKGIKLAGKFMPLNIILKKIKALIKPLLNKVLKFAIGKLPKNLQPHARTLAKKFLNIEVEYENANPDAQSENGLEGIQSELDNHFTQLLFTPNEQEADTLVMEYENSFEALESTGDFESEFNGSNSLDAARQQFINELKNLQADESPAPAIERFLPVQPAIKLAITLIGRPKVINFLAGLLSKLVSKYVPENVAKPLAASIVDVGMRTMGFEVNDEAGQTDLAYEAIANTIEETFENMNNLNEAAINDSEELTMQLLEAFEQAAADNFPSQYIKEELRPTKQRALWIKMPRTTPVKYYKKYSHPYDITIDPQTASSVKIFRGLPLANFLRDKYGLDASKPIRAKVFLYEAIRGTRLSMISRYENLQGLNARQPKAWVQLLPLTKQAASLLLKENSLGRDINVNNLTTRFRTRPGQRFYYLEIEGAKLRLPQVNRSAHKHVQSGRPHSATESRSADIQCSINFIKSEIKLNYYFSEEDAIAVIEKLNKNDMLGAAINIRQSVKNVLNDLLIKNIPGKVKIVHEAIPELFLENMNDQQEQFAPLDMLGQVAGKGLITKLIGKLVEKLTSVAYDAVVNLFKARAAEFKTAQAQPQDGVTIKISWKNISGMNSIRAIINAIKGKLSVGNLTDLALPNFPVPEIKIEADKKFD